MPGASAAATGSSNTTTLIIALVVGLCAGILVISGLGLLGGYLLRRHWMAKRQASFERARLQDVEPVSTGPMPGFRPYLPATHQTDKPLYNVPVSQESTPPRDDAAAQATPVSHEPTGAPATAIEPVLSIPSTDEEDVRYPSLISEYAARPSLTLDRQPVNETASPTLRSPRTASLRNKFHLAGSRGTRSSLRHTSLRLSHSMLSRFRSSRHSRNISLESGESIGMPDHQIPMARRINRKEQRFQYDSSSYTSSAGAHDDDVPERGPAQDSIAMPPPARLRPAPTMSPEQLHDRIKAWQECSIDADVPEDMDAQSLVGELPKTQLRRMPTALRRSATQSTARSTESAYSSTSMNEGTRPTAANGVPLLRIPSIRPQFMASTSLESWLGPEDPRMPATEGAPQRPLFTEVPMDLPTQHETTATATATTSVTPVRAQAPSTNAEPTSTALVRRASRPLSAHSQRPHAPRTPSPLAQSVTEEPGMEELPSLAHVQLYLEPMDASVVPPASTLPVAAPTQAPAHQSYAMSSSSRSSFPSSARMSNDLPRNWKHTSNGTVSTEITWADDASAAHTKEGHAFRRSHSLDRQRSLMCVPEQPQGPPPAFMSSTPYSASTGGGVRGPRRAPSPSTASSESVATRHDDGVATTAMSPMSVLSSPMQTMQAWFRFGGDKADTSADLAHDMMTSPPTQVRV